MAILASDIKLLASERPTDNEDGGGYASANEVLDNVDNNVFPDISSGDRVTGRARIRMIIGGVRSPDTDTYIGARAYIASPPSDTAVGVALFPVVVGSTHTEMMEILYRYSNSGSNSNYRLYSNYDIGETIITLYHAIGTNQTIQPTLIFSSGDTIILEDSANDAYQVVTIKQYNGSRGGSASDYVAYSYTLAQPLNASFRGAFYTNASHSEYVTPTQIYKINPLKIPIYGLRTLSEIASSGNRSVIVSDNEFSLAPIVNYFINDTAEHDGVGIGGVTHVEILSAATSRTQILPLIGTYNYLHQVSYIYQGNWKDYAITPMYNQYNFIVTLPDIPDVGSNLLYYSNNGSSYNSDTKFVFRLRAPVVPGSVNLSATSLTSTILTAIDDGLGGWTGDDVSSGSIDYASGLIGVTLSEECSIGSVLIDYQTTIVADDLDVGINLAKLPPSKTAPLFRIGDSVMVHNTVHQTLTNPVVSSTTYTLSRANVDQVWLEAANGTRIPTAKYTVNLATASVTMAAGLDLSGYSQPLEAYTTIQDETVIVAVSGDGTTLQLNQALSHTYAANTSYVSSVMKTGDLFAFASVPFSQQAWTSVWSDTLIGNSITPQFNHVVYPIEISNNGAITERWRIHFTSTTLVNVIGERVGQIATGLSITSDIAPINPYTGTPYFTLPHEGWGAAWVSGNLLRFNTIGADAGIGCLQVIQPSEHVEGVSDRFRLVFLGDVNA